jgi:hypothetical protein
MTDNIESRVQKDGFRDGFHWAFTYPIRLRDYGDFIREIPSVVRDLIKGPDHPTATRRSILGTATGVTLNPTSLGIYAVGLIIYDLVK